MIRLASTHPEWVLGYTDEVWWSRLAQPQLPTWMAKQPLRLVANAADKKNPEPTALACYGLLQAGTERIWLRFVAGRPVSPLTLQFLPWSCRRLQRQGKKALLVIWDKEIILPSLRLCCINQQWTNTFPLLSPAYGT